MCRHETVKLRLGERIGSLLFDRVLGGEDEEGVGETVPLAPHGNLTLLHRLQECGLRLGRSPVDLVGQHDIGEDRASQKLELPDPGRLVLLDDLRAGDVRRHQVGRELDPVVAQIQGVGHGVDHEGLGQAGDTDQETVPTGEDGDQELLEDGVLTDNHLGHFGLEFGECLFQAQGRGNVVVTLKRYVRVCVAHACLPVFSKESRR